MGLIKIQEGDWFCAIEGIAIADKIYNFYFEEYTSIPQNKNIGDFHYSIIAYRLFCDFDGQPIKRNRFKFFNAKYCTPLTKKMEIILRHSIKNNPKEYTSFISFLKTPKRIKGNVTLNYSIAKTEKNNIVNDLKAIVGKLPPKFTFLDFQKITEENKSVIKKENMINSTYDVQIYVSVHLVYYLGDSKNKRILFNTLNYELIEKP